MKKRLREGSSMRHRPAVLLSKTILSFFVWRTSERLTSEYRETGMSILSLRPWTMLVCGFVTVWG